MKVLFFSRRFYPQIGGVEKHVLEIGTRLVKRGYEVTVVSESANEFSQKDKISGIKILRINAGKENKLKKFRIWVELFRNINLIRSADIIHCHDVFFWYLPFRFIFPFKKVYTTFHGYEGNAIPTKKAILMHKISEKLSYGNICVGEFFKKWYGTNPSYVIYGGVDESLLDQGRKNKKPLKDIVFLGRLEEETGILKYLKTLKLLKDEGYNLEMDVFGDGSLSDKAKAYTSENNLKVNFKGFIVNPERYLSDYKYVFVSRYLGILEALASKRPVFAEYNNEIKKDYLEMTPFSKYIFIFSKPQELFEMLKEHRVMSSNFIRIRSHTWDNVSLDYLKLWQIRM